MTDKITGPNGEELIEPPNPVIGPHGERCWYAADYAQGLISRPCWGWITIEADGIPYCNGHRHPAQIAAGMDYAPRTIHGVLKLNFDAANTTLKGG